MHNHDHDLIATVAEGLLAADLASAAEAEISACPECSADLSSQRLALNSLASLGPAAMTATESQAMRNAVADALGLADPVAAPTPRRSRRSLWPAVAIAASLAGIVTIVPVLGLITGGNDDSDMTAAAVFQEADTTAIGADALEMAPLDDSTALTSQATAEAGQEESVAGVGEAPSTTISLNAGEPPGMTAYAADGEAAIRDLYEAGSTDAYLGADQQLERSGLACNAEAEQQFGNKSVYVHIPATLDDGRSVVLYVSEDWKVLVAFDITDCSVALTIP